MGQVKRPAEAERKRGAPKPWANSWWLGLSLLAYYSAAMIVVVHRLNWAPRVLGLDAPLELFSEARAMQHVVALARDLPDRQISMPQLQQAHDYLQAQGEALAEMARQRGDVDVQVYREHVTGAVPMSFMGRPFTNAYRNLTNVVVTITPRGVAGRRGLLIAAHQDSAVASPGASDDAQMVGAMLELARTLLARPQLPAVPLVLLFDGGEESVCQAANGFMASSPHAASLGAFVNLESMGVGGLPILFQHTGAWTVEAWARGARHAHGARIAQDIFDTGVIPGDTDYRMFSARHYGTLPGLDLAFIRGSVAYHTKLDAVESLKPGGLQDIGNSLLGGTYALCDALAQREQRRAKASLTDLASEPGSDAAAAATPPEAAPKPGAAAAVPRSETELAVYFDLLGLGMVTYRDTTARLLHNVPLCLSLMLPLTSVSAGQSAAGVSGRMVAACARALCSVLLALLLPALLGIARVLATGRAMVWFTHHSSAYAMFLPAGALGALGPWLSVRARATRERPYQQGHFMACQVYGFGLLLSLLGAVLSAFALQGASQVFAMGGMLALVVGGIVDGQPERLCGRTLVSLLAAATLPLLIMGAILGTFVGVMMERMGLGGHLPGAPFLADAIVGALCGAAVLGMTCSCLLPVIAYALAPARKPLVALLLATSIASAAYATYRLPHYTPATPRRVTLTHVHETGSWVPPDDGHHPVQHAAPEAELASVGSETAEVAGTTAESCAGKYWPAAVASKLAVGIIDSNPWSQLFPQLGDGAAGSHGKAAAAAGEGEGLRVLGLPLAAAEGHEYAFVYPLDLMLGKLVLAAQPGAKPLVSVPPYVRKVREEGAPGGATRKLHLRLFTQLHCWGVLNVTTLHGGARLVAWSLAGELVPLRGRAGQETHMVRFTHEAADPFWDIWLELQHAAADGSSSAADAGAGAVHVGFTVSYLQMTDELRSWMGQLPEWATSTWHSTTYHSQYDFEVQPLQQQ